MNNPTVLEIVKEYLMKNHFDGLYNEDLECGCSIDNLNPCGDFSGNCKAGYRVEAAKTSFGPDYDDYICEKKSA